MILRIVRASHNERRVLNFDSAPSFGLPKIILLFEPHLFDQGLGFGLVSPEIHIERHRMFVTALRENLTAESLRHFGIEDTLLLEQREGIGRKYLGPLVTVITGSISAGKNVAESRRHRSTLTTGSTWAGAIAVRSNSSTSPSNGLSIECHAMSLSPYSNWRTLK